MTWEKRAVSFRGALRLTSSSVILKAQEILPFYMQRLGRGRTSAQVR